MVVTLVPYPFSALTEARTSARHSCARLAVAWQDFGNFFCSLDADDREYGKDRLLRARRQVVSELEALASNISASAWELGNIPWRYNSRVMLQREHKALCEVQERLYSVWHNCVEEDFNNNHFQIARGIKNSVQRVVSEAAALFWLCTEHACRGSVGNGERSKELITSLHAAIGELASNFRQVQAELGRGGLNDDSIDDFCFVLHLSAYGRIIAEFAEALHQHDEGGSRLSLNFGTAKCSIFNWDVLSDRDHLSFTVRNTMCILWGLCLGWSHPPGFQAFDAGIASTSAMLLSTFGGSALQKNMQRLQGVTMGNLVGTVIYNILGTKCGLQWAAALGIAMFFCMASSLFMYYDFSRYSSTGLLLAYYGAGGMLQGCGKDLDGLHDTFYFMIFDCICALFLTITVDLILARDLPSYMALNKLSTTWTGLAKSTMMMLKISPDRATELSANRRGILIAEALGEEARHDATLSRPLWNTTVFTAAIGSALHVHTHLSCAYHCLQRSTVGGPGAVDAKSLMQLQSFANILNIVSDRMVDLHRVVGDFERAYKGLKTEDNVSLWSNIASGTKTRHCSNEFREAVNIYIGHVNAWQPKHGSYKAATKSMEDDAYAQVAVVISSMAGVLKEVRLFQHCVLREGTE